MSFPTCVHGPVKRIGLRIELRQQLPHVSQHLAIESRARLADVNQPALLVVESEHERSEIFPRSFRLGVSPDDTLNFFCDLDLQPFAAAFLLVTAAAALGDDALESLFLCNLIESHSVSYLVIGIAHVIARDNQVLQYLFALFQIDPVQVVAIHPNQIESVIKDWNVFPSWRPKSSMPNSGALLHEAERRTALLVHGDNFTIQNRRLSAQEPRHVS